MNREEIKQYLPHREPMLLVDEMELVDETDKEGKTVTYVYSKYTVTGEEFFLKGHFPSYPIVPGVIICEIMGQSCALLLGDDIKGKRTLYTGINNVKFKHPVRPHDTINVRACITARRANLVFVQAEATVEGNLCCRGDLSFALI